MVLIMEKPKRCIIGFGIMSAEIVKCSQWQQCMPARGLGLNVGMRFSPPMTGMDTWQIW